MSGFIASGSAAEGFLITNDGFWIDIDVAHMRASIRVDASVSDARIEVAAVNALIQVNKELAQVRARYEAEGYNAIGQVPSAQIQEESFLVHLYRRAIYTTVGAEIAERYRSYDSTGEGNRNADELTPSVDEYRRDARFAIRDLLGTGHCTVELI